MPTAVIGQAGTSAAEIIVRADSLSVSSHDQVECFLISPCRTNEPPTETSDASYSRQIEKDAQDQLIRINRGESPQRRFQVLQQWEGVVTKAESDALWADLLDLTNTSSAKEVAEIPLIEIPLADQSLLMPGCVFYWTMGYETSPGGQIRRVSEIRVRRTPVWSQGKIEAIHQRGNELFERYTQNGEDNTACRE